MNRQQLETALAAYPLYDYAFFTTDELVFSERVRSICERECPMYNRSWACPPAVGTVEACRARVMAYREGLMIVTIAEVGDIDSLAETLPTRAAHVAITRDVLARVREQAGDTLTLSAEACAVCDPCAWPDGPCRRPECMFPCIESHGILLTELARSHGIEVMAGGNLVTWFSLIFYKE